MLGVHLFLPLLQGVEIRRGKCVLRAFKELKGVIHPKRSVRIIKINY
jgi:hypothetical protein